MGGQEFFDLIICPQSLLTSEVAVMAAGYCHELIRHFNFLQGLTQPHSVGVGNSGIGVAVDCNDRGPTGPHIVDRRDAASDLAAVLHS